MKNTTNYSAVQGLNTKTSSAVDYTCVFTMMGKLISWEGYSTEETTYSIAYMYIYVGNEAV